MNVWLEVVGWVGSILIVLSLTQARVLRFRWMNLTGSVVATTYNSIIGIWPFAAMNLAITLINVYWLLRLYREAHDEAVYEVLEVGAEDAYLQRVLRVHAADIAKSHPAFVAGSGARSGDRSAFLIVRGDETVGAVVVRDAGDGEGVVELDWVTPRFRDFSPGEFVHRRSSIFTDRGFRRIVVERAPAGERAYLERVGFRPEGDRWIRTV